MTRSGKLVFIFGLCALVVGILAAVMGPGYFLCGVLQGCGGPRSFIAYLLEPLLGYDLGKTTAHILDLTPFTGTVVIFVIVAWLAKGRDQSEEVNEALTALNRCDGCNATFRNFDYLTKVEGKGFLCEKCRSAPAQTPLQVDAEHLCPNCKSGPTEIYERSREGEAWICRACNHTWMVSA